MKRDITRAGWGGGQSLAILTMALDSEVFAIEAEMVREILDLMPVTTVPNARPYVGGVINVRGKVVPLMDLRVRFGLPPVPPTIDTRIVVIEVAVDDEPMVIGILADKVFEVTEATAASLEAPPRIGMCWRAEFIRCVGKSESGFVIVLDIRRIVAADDRADLGSAAA